MPHFSALVPWMPTWKITCWHYHWRKHSKCLSKLVYIHVQEVLWGNQEREEIVYAVSTASCIISPLSSSCWRTTCIRQTSNTHTDIFTQTDVYMRAGLKTSKHLWYSPFVILEESYKLLTSGSVFSVLSKGNTTIFTVGHKLSTISTRKQECINLLKFRTNQGREINSRLCSTTFSWKRCSLPHQEEDYCYFWRKIMFTPLHCDMF